MRTISLEDYKLYERICQLDEKNLFSTMESYLKSIYKDVVSHKDNAYIMATGDIPIVLCAHLDTVFNSPTEHMYYDARQGVIWSPEGGIGDDRAGVFAILSLLKEGYRPSVIFTTGEETGGKGAAQLVSVYPTCPIEDVKYIIQLDRRNAIDCVFYDCDNMDFVKYVESFGFKEAFGSFTDISTICPKWGIAGVNLSVGYCDEHSYTEVLHINWLLDTIDKVKTMLDSVSTLAEPFKYIPCMYGSSWKHYTQSYWDHYWDDEPDEYITDTAALVSPTEEDDDEEDYQSIWDLFDEQTYYRCFNCGKKMEEYESFPVDADGANVYCCSDCLALPELNIEWCQRCNYAFISDDDSKLCSSCQKIKENDKSCTTKIKSKNKSKK